MSSTLTTALPVDVTGLTPTQRETLANILSDVKSSIDKLAKAARAWVELPEGARRKIIDQTNPSLRDFWAKLSAVGNGALHPQLAAVGGRAAALLGKLPIEEQEKYVTELIPVAVVKGRGYDQRLVDVAEMSEDQRRQVFRVAEGVVAVRDFEQQKHYLAEKVARQMVIDAALRMDGGKRPYLGYGGEDGGRANGEGPAADAEGSGGVKGFRAVPKFISNNWSWRFRG